MEKITLKYSEIYEKINELNSFVNSDILSENMKNHEELLSLLADMSGKANERLIDATSLEFDKIQNSAKILLSLVDFIKKSTKLMEEKDEDLASLIDRSEVI